MSVAETCPGCGQRYKNWRDYPGETFVEIHARLFQKSREAAERNDYSIRASRGAVLREMSKIKREWWKRHVSECEAWHEAGGDDLPAFLLGPRDQARRIILKELEQGESPAAFIRLLTKEAGIGWRTVMNVKKALGVVSYRVSAGNKGAGGWYWALPERMASHAA